MWCSISSFGDLSQQLLCSQQPNKRLLSAHAISILLRLSRSLKMGLNNRVIPHTVSLWSEEDARLSGTKPEIRELLVLHSTRCCKAQEDSGASERRLTLCASPGSALFVRRKRRPLVTRENTHRSTAMRHQPMGTHLSAQVTPHLMSPYLRGKRSK